MATLDTSDLTAKGSDAEARARALDMLGLLGTEPEPGFDAIVGLAALICEAPVALVSLVGSDRQWFKARVGFEACETTLDRSVCVHALADPTHGALVIPDLSADSRTRDNPSVTGEPHLRFYGGAKLVMADGQAIGTLCVLDHVTRPDGLTTEQANALVALAGQVMGQLELRRTARALVQAERREVERARRQRDQDRTAREDSESRYRTLFDTIEQGFCVIEFFDGPHGPLSDYVHVEANAAYERHTGIAGIVGKTLRGFAPDEADGWVEIYGGVLRTGKPVRFEREFVVAGRFIEVTATRIEPAGRRQVAVLFADITGRRRAEAALRRLNETLEDEVEARTRERDQLWNTSPDLMLVIGFDGLIRRTNPAWKIVLGYEASELAGRHVTEFVVPADQEETTRAVDVAARGGMARMVNRYRHRDGSVRWMSWVAASAGDVTYATGRDITLEKEQAEALARTEDALRQSQKMEAVGQLTGGVAHDFNNLLTVIKSSTDLLKRPTLSEERRIRYVGASSAPVDRASKLTGQLLAFARRQTLKPEVFAACDSVRALTEMMGTLTGSRVTIVTELPEETCFVNADPSQFDTALVNIAVNARDAMDGEGRLTIRVEAVEAMPAIRSRPTVPQPFVAVSISDTGSGIPEKHLEQIFEPFFTTKGVGQGTGLGLSQVFGFAKQSGGEVVVTSEVGQGTSFTLYLPRVGAEPQAAEPAEPQLPMDGHGTAVLVVEDNADVGTFAVQTLKDLGYVTVLATNAEEALVELETDANRFDVVFSDVVMPGMNGIDLAHEIRRRYHDLPVLLASGYSHVLAQNGTYGFELLHKPYSVEQLSRLLRKVATWQRSRRILGQ